MDRLLADTNIFGIAVDRLDSRRLPVWRTLGKVASGKLELFVADIVIAEIKRNPHKATLKKELALVNGLVSKVFGFGREAKRVAVVLEKKAGLDVVDARIVAIAVVNDLVFWSGDRRILKGKTVKEINSLLGKAGLPYTFKYKRE